MAVWTAVARAQGPQSSGGDLPKEPRFPDGGYCRVLPGILGRRCTDVPARRHASATAVEAMDIGTSGRQVADAHG